MYKENECEFKAGKGNVAGDKECPENNWIYNERKLCKHLNNILARRCYNQRASEENYKYLYFQEVNEVNVYQNGGINALFS